MSNLIGNRDSYNVKRRNEVGVVSKPKTANTWSNLTENLISCNYSISNKQMPLEDGESKVSAGGIQSQFLANYLVNNTGYVIIRSTNLTASNYSYWEKSPSFPSYGG